MSADPWPSMPEWDIAQWFNTDQPLRVADLRGQVVLIHAFQMRCPGCVMHAIPQARQVHEQFADQGVALQFTGLGSLMQLHALTGAVRSADDTARSDDRAKALIFFDLLARGVFMARRGFMALSLPFDEAACDRFAQALEEVVSAQQAVLPRR